VSSPATAALALDTAVTAHISPRGAPRLRPAPAGETDGLAPTARRRIVDAFERGGGHGLLVLGAAAPTTDLPAPLAFLRDVGRLYVTRLCASPDLETARGRVRVSPPGDELGRLASAVPPMLGAEYVDDALLGRWWGEMGDAFAAAVADHEGSVESWLHALHPVWNLVGRVCFHLAENRGDPSHPFAFLATYTTRVSTNAVPQHVPLSRALGDSSGRRDRDAMLSLLVPVHRAAERSALVAEMLEGGDLYHPVAWSPADAYRFLKEIPVLEAAGIVVRVPDWWKARRPPRPEVRVTVGAAPAAGLGVDAMLDFSVDVTLDGQPLTEAELRALVAGADGLVPLRGRWVEVDRDRLRDVLAHWRAVERASEDGISFLDGMRLLAGARIGPDDAALPEADGGSRVVAGDWLRETLAALRSPEAAAAADPGPALRTALRPYQQVGVRWLWFATRLRLGVCLADDMGLGKTVQVIALMLVHRRRAARDRAPDLLVVPASLLANWQDEIARFAPSLRVLVAHPSAMPRAALAALGPARLRDVDVVVTTYGTVARLPWITAATWSLVVLDEAQNVKNPGARQTRAVKQLRGLARIALTGTPVENRLADLWSLFDFLNPGLLGSARAFAAFVKALERRPDERWAPLRRLVQPYLLRRRKDDPAVIADLPDKTEVKAFCGLARPQAALYQKTVDALARELRAGPDDMRRRGIVLAYLLRLKQICNHPSHYLGDGAWSEDDSGKLRRLREIGEAVAAKQEKALVFTQFREISRPLASFLSGVFGGPGLVLTGETPVRERRGLVQRFQEDERIGFFVLTTKAGGTGLNLTAASHVVHFDRWWNPAVENQATDRAYRIGQRRNVLVHKLVCRGTIEERIDALIESKLGLARDLVDGDGAERALTELGDAELLELASLDLSRASAEA
jgi:non-specific serine/threonine protein kinase